MELPEVIRIALISVSFADMLLLHDYIGLLYLIFITEKIDVFLFLDQIKASLRAIRNMDNLPVLRMPDDKDKSVNDILEWLASAFGFQVKYTDHDSPRTCSRTYCRM